MTDTFTVTKSAILRFSQVDDEVTVTINGSQEFYSGIVRHNQPVKEENITDALRPGKNDLQLVAKNGPSTASLVGQLIVAGAPVHEWNIKAENRAQQAVFETYTASLDLEAAGGVATGGKPVVLSCIEIDDEVDLFVDDERVFSHGLLRHNQPRVEHSMSVASGSKITVQLTNGPGPATLVGTLTVDGKVLMQTPVRGDSRVHGGVAWTQDYTVP